MVITFNGLAEKCEQLNQRGYMAHIVPGNDFIWVNGYNKKYFNAKKAKADSVVAGLNSMGFVSLAWHKLSYDGFYDIMCK